MPPRGVRAAQQTALESPVVSPFGTDAAAAIEAADALPPIRCWG